MSSGTGDRDRAKPALACRTRATCPSNCSAGSRPSFRGIIAAVVRIRGRRYHAYVVAFPECCKSLHVHLGWCSESFFLRLRSTYLDLAVRVRKEGRGGVRSDWRHLEDEVVVRECSGRRHGRLREACGRRVVQSCICGHRNWLGES